MTIFFTLCGSMGNPESGCIESSEAGKQAYAVSALPPEDVATRIKSLVDSLRFEFGGPELEPHITVVGLIRLTEDDALEKFRSACERVKAYEAIVDGICTGTSFYQCVYLLIHPTPEVMETSSHCSRYFGYHDSTPYMPHLSLLYGNLSDEKKQQAKELATKLDESIIGLSFPITQLALYKLDTTDNSLVKIAQHDLS